MMQSVLPKKKRKMTMKKRHNLPLIEIDNIGGIPRSWLVKQPTTGILYSLVRNGIELS